MYSIDDDEITAKFLIENYGIPIKLSNKIIESGNGYNFAIFDHENDDDFNIIIFKNGFVDTFLSEMDLVKTLFGRGLCDLGECIEDISFLLINNVLYDKYDVNIKYINAFDKNENCRYGILFNGGDLVTFSNDRDLHRSVAGIENLPEFNQRLEDINMIICNGVSYLHYDINAVFYEPKHTGSKIVNNN